MGRIRKGATRKTQVRRKGDGYISEWQRNIWVEYGTLANRARGHKFKNPRKAKSAKWKGGIKPVLASERAWAETESSVIAAIPKEVTAEARKYANKINKKWLWD